MAARWRLLLALAVWARSACALVLPRCPSDAAERCVAGGSGDDKYNYTVDGVDLLIEYTAGGAGGHFNLYCTKNLTLDNPALPRFESQVRMLTVGLVNCQPPRISYADAFDALNFTVVTKLTLTDSGLVERHHLAGLEQLTALSLNDLRLAPGALSALPALGRLFLDGVAPPPGEFQYLPRSLNILILTRTGTTLNATDLMRLTKLETLSVHDSIHVDVQLAGTLQILTVDAPATNMPTTLLPTLRRFILSGWEERQPVPWTTCNALDTLNLRDPAVKVLPAGWVQACRRLRVLKLQDARQLTSLEAGVLRGAFSLRMLRLTKCAFTELPVGLLDDAVKLTELDLSGNRLRELPSRLFARTKSLQSLNLSNNLLVTQVFTSLQAVMSLKILDLSENVGLLKNSCARTAKSIPGISPLVYLFDMTELNLRNTSAALICNDWREYMALLTKLDLSNNNFTSITYLDLQFHGKKPVVVNLKGNNLSRLNYTRENYEEVMNGDGSSPASVVFELDAELSCDCGVYWAVRALHERPQHVWLGNARCRATGPLGPEPLASAPLDELLCADRELCAGAPAACACAWREDAAPPGRRLRLRCEHANLTHVPDLHALSNVSPGSYSWDLRLAHNHIDELRVDDLPANLSVLDLRYNALSTIAVDVAHALVADERRRVWLAGNPLECGCNATATLEAFRARPGPLADYGNATCYGGAALRLATPAPCALATPPAPRTALLAGAAAAALLLGAALAGLLALPALRLRLKLALHAVGWLSGGDSPDDGRRFDAFVSFSHGDEQFVRSELVARLESGPAPYRLCVHYRDWVPGGWIPAQIAASVRASRRTIAVLSEHFLRSAWARAEFREAHALALRDQEPRLVVVLLDDPAALPLDDKLRRYLATNTYVRWGDPWFWQKLRLALPRSRGRESSDAPPDPVPVDPVPTVLAVLAPAEPATPSSPTPVVVSPTSSQVLSDAPSWSDNAIELDLLVKPPCTAHCASDVTSHCASDVTSSDAQPLHIQC